ncbi:hypothetical protein K4A83_08280 [Spirulina subsalsa FACHB-351]|uniref:Uncharacterized protein n=2 Tax=Spirulina subsalsa TaxID=54311 RepID=A0ABT3L429_9CYAN|nr:hypothetical protein [Spirulina subsalsa FACHB-351]
MKQKIIKSISFLTIVFGSIVAQVSPTQAAVGASAYVYDPPSNIRQVPNGNVICQVRQRKEIFLLARAFYQGRFNGWYLTDACSPADKPGTVWGVIHGSQFRITQRYSNLLLVDSIPFINCASKPSNVPENCLSDWRINR